MEKKQLGNVLIAVGLIPGIWALIKGRIIGFYPDELFPQVVLPGLIAAGLIALGTRLSRSAADEKKS